MGDIEYTSQPHSGQIALCLFSRNIFLSNPFINHRCVISLSLGIFFIFSSTCGSSIHYLRRFLIKRVYPFSSFPFFLKSAPVLNSSVIICQIQTQYFDKNLNQYFNHTDSCLFFLQSRYISHMFEFKMYIFSIV